MHGQTKRYRIIEIGTLNSPYDDMSTARGINELGQITGWSLESSSFTPHSLLWLPESSYGLPQGPTDLTELADQNDPTNSFGGGLSLDINIDGIAIGRQVLDSSSSVFEAFVWDLSAPSHDFYSLGTLDDPQNNLRESIAAGISDTSPAIVAGGSTIEQTCTVQFREQGFTATLDGTNTLVPLNFPGGSQLSEAYDINTLGTQSAGESYTCGPSQSCESDYDAVLWQGQTGIALNDIVADVGSKGRGINNSGNIVGEGYDSAGGGCTLFALYWESATSQPSILGNTLPPGQAGDASHAEALTEPENGCVSVVGWNDSLPEALIWHGSSSQGWCVESLNDITIPCDHGYDIERAFDINSHRHIAGRARNPAGKDVGIALTCIADISGDFKVNGADSGLLLGAWCTSGCTQSQLDTGDLNCDGKVDGGDMGLLLGAWTDQNFCTISPICSCESGGQSAQGGEPESESAGLPLEEALEFVGFDSPQSFLAWSAEGDPDEVNTVVIIINELMDQ